MPVNALESFVDGGPSTEEDRAWFRIVRQPEEIRGRHAQQYSIQTSQREANGHGEVPFIPTSAGLELLLDEMNATTLGAIYATLDLFSNIETLESVTELMMTSDTEDSDDDSDEDEESGFQFSPCQVEDFMQTLSRVEMGMLEADDLRCSICKEEYGKYRGNSTEQGSDSDWRLLVEEEPEYPLEFSCHHVFGEWCIRTWLLQQPASCPACRFQFRPVELIDNSLVD